jgi:hypothetical protein
MNRWGKGIAIIDLVFKLNKFLERWALLLLVIPLYKLEPLYNKNELEYPE